MHLPRHSGRRTKPCVSSVLYPFAIIPILCLFILGTLFIFYFSPFKHPLLAKASSGLVQLPGHVPGLLKKSQLVGPADPTIPIAIMVGLRLRNATDLATYVNALSRPHSGRHYLTPEQIAKAYAPLPSDQQAVIDYLQQAGFTITTTFRHHMLIGLRGTIGQAESAFHVQINTYRAPSGRQFYAPTTNPSVPASLAGIIQSVSGLDTAAHYDHPPVLTPQRLHMQTNAQGVQCPAPSAMPHRYYTPSQIASGYNLNGLYNAGFHGEGQTVALFELDDYAANDIAAYTKCYGGASVPISRIPVKGGTGQAPGGSAIEVELDMELILSAAPHLAALRVYEAPNNTTGLISEWAQIVSDAVPVVSTSWGTCEPSVTQATASQENALFTIAAAQGQSIFAASGDNGTDDCNNGTTEAVDDPASQPYVIGVGGTSLGLDAANNYNNEQVWNGGKPNGHFVGSGGGVSTFWTMPAWQQSPGVTAKYSSTTACATNTGNSGKYCREVPDVSLNADPNTGYPVYCTVIAANCSTTNAWTTVGGTSAAAPLWAAINALANQKSLQDGNFNLGLLGPLLYQIGQSASGSKYSNDFHDIQFGNNAAFSDGKYPSGPNYDMASGLGSCDAFTLANDLEMLAKNTTNARTSPANTTWYFAEGSVGNGFSEFITLLNPSATQVATINITYLFEHQPAITVQHIVNPSTRATVSANTDLNIPASAQQQSISAIVQSSVPIVAERPMYFNLHGIASGTDTLGATDATHTTFYFAEGDSRQDLTRSYSTFITMLNPSTTQIAHVTITYYSNGKVVGTQPINVGPLQRGTGTPAALGINQQVAIKVTSDIGIVVERPMYFSDNIPNAGGVTTGAASTIGATTTGGDWLFAEGYTGPNFQEYLVLANFDTTPAPATVQLEYGNGTFQRVQVMVPALSQYYVDVNNIYTHTSPQSCGCIPTADVSAEVTSTSTAIVAERLMYFHFGSTHISGGTDVVGAAGPASHSVYAFAEGFTYSGFSEFLTLQNPNSTAETVAITLFADNAIVQVSKQLQPHSRTTVSINSLVAPMATAYPTNPVTQGYEVSMDIQALSGTVVAERPLYFNWHGDPGGTDVLGYTGG